MAGVIPTYFEREATDCVEDYTYNKETKNIEVEFSYRAKGSAPEAEPSKLLQRANVKNPGVNTRWGINPKLGFFIPLNLDYLVADCSEDYSECIIGVPSRANVWIMARTPAMAEERYAAALQRAVELGFDAAKVVRVPHTQEARARPA